MITIHNHIIPIDVLQTLIVIFFYFHIIAADKADSLPRPSIHQSNRYEPRLKYLPTSLLETAVASQEWRNSWSGPRQVQIIRVNICPVR